MKSHRRLGGSKLETSEYLSKLKEVYERLPHPVKFYNDAAVCPWCGSYHKKINWGDVNSCNECNREFYTGFAEWTNGNDFHPWTWVDFNSSAWEELGCKVDLVPHWEPNERLKQIYQNFNLFYDDKTGQLKNISKTPTGIN